MRREARGLISCQPSSKELDRSIVVERAQAPPGVDDPADYLFLRGLIQGMRCGILTVDPGRRIRLVNCVAQDILGLDGVHEGVPLAEALARHPRIVRVLEDSFAMASLPNRAEIELGEGPGGGKTVGFTLSRVRDQSGDTCGVAMFFKDLTQIEHKEEQERLRDRLAALGQMAASLAHEIRNPLAAIEVTCSLLRRRLGAEQPGALELLEKIVAEVRRLNSTVSTSLEFVRPVSLRLESAPLLPLLEEAITVAAGRRGGPGIEIRRQFSGEVPPFLMDRLLLRQVFENLLLNALEAVGEEGTVTITTGVMDAPSEASVPYQPAGPARGEAWPSAERFVVVRVADTGPGIVAEDMDRIFYPLFTTKKQGSGIGLSVVRKIVSSHHGLIDVESTPGRGAQFSVRLPIALPRPEVRAT